MNLADQTIINGIMANAVMYAARETGRLNAKSEDRENPAVRELVEFTLETIRDLTHVPQMFGDIAKNISPAQEAREAQVQTAGHAQTERALG